MKFPSSIFSFDTFVKRAPPRAFVLSMIVFLATIFVAEIGSRYLMRPVGDYVWAYWDKQAVNKFEWYRKLAKSGQQPKVVAIGDSTGAVDFNPITFSKGLSGLTAYNLAYLAHTPIALKITTLPLLKDYPKPRVLFWFQSAWTFEDALNVDRNEANVLSCVLGKRESGEILPSDFLYLIRLYPARHFIVKHWLRGQSLVFHPPNEGFMGITKDNPPGWLNDPRGRNNKDEAKSRAFSAKRRSVVKDISSFANENNMLLIMVIAPIKDKGVSMLDSENRAWLLKEADKYGFQIWDFSNSEFLSPQVFADHYHLWREGANIFSEKMGQRFRRLLENKRSLLH